MTTFLRLATAVLVMAWAARAVSAPASASARLTYARSPGASSCPDEGALRAAVATRVGYDPFFAWAKRTVVVQVWRDRGRYMARMQIIDEQGLSRGTRELSSNGRDCAELFDTVALAISIAMDQLPKDEPPSPTETAPAAPVAEATPASLPSPPPPAEPAPLPAEAHPPPGAPATDHPRVGLGLDGLGSLGTAPAFAVGGSVGLGVRWPSVSTSLELRADAPASGPSATGAGRVTAGSYVATLVPCGHYSVAYLCGVGTLGLLHAESSDIVHPRSDSTLLAAAGGRLGLEWPVSRGVALRAHLDIVLDLRRATFLFDGQDAWTAPVLAGTGGLGVFAYFE